MSIGTSAVTADISAAIKRVSVSGGPVWYRQLVSVTLSGTAATPANIVFLVYRGITLVALVDGFNASYLGLMDTNTSEIGTVLTGSPEGAVNEFTVYAYNSDPTSLELLGFGTMDILTTRDYATPSPIPPISSTTLFIGCFAFYNGKTYIRSSTDNLYYEFAAARSGDEVTESLGTVGITIPGSP